MDKITSYTQQIHHCYPDFSIESAVLNRDGQYNDVLVVNDAFIFRFAKVAPAIETMRREVELLHRFQPHISLPIPQPAFVHTESAVLGEVFMGYPLVPGQPLWREAFQAINDSDGLARMAGQLAGFLRELHHTPPDQIVPSGQPVADSPADMADLYTRIQANLYGYMRPDAQAGVTAHFERYFVNADRHPYTPTLRHGDFGTGNLLHDPETLSITGILDFSFTGLGDPAADFAGLYVSYGEDFYRRCYDVYPAMETALERVHFYRGIFALEEAIFGLEHNDNEAFQEGICSGQRDGEILDADERR
ncbi:MAG: aminoglycoside phosphotransferase family protein [Chloroflexi bacterium]|nr:MAG: aminoglycoside phosphotransferase family protein [Chloroflexota bacterium]